MKIAFIVSQFPAVSETFILSQITGLFDRGAEIDILARTELPQPVEHPAVTAYGLRGRTRYADGPPDGRWGPRLKMVGMLGSAPFRVPLNGTSVQRLFRHGLSDARRTIGFTSSTRQIGSYDVIHCHFGPMGKWGMSLRSMGLLKGRLVTTFHGYDMCRPFREEGPHVYDRLFEEGDLFLPISEYWRDRLIAHGCPPEQTFVHHMGVDCEAFDFRPRAIEPTEPVRILSVSRLAEKKGLEYAIRAVAAVIKDLERDGSGIGPGTSGIEYTVVGSGPRGAELEQLTHDLGISESVQFLGSRPRNEVADLMGRAHIFLAPSVTAEDGNKEGIPVALMEAMATGLPVVSSEHSGIPELVENGVTGLLAEERDVDGLEDRIHRLVADPTLYRRLAEAGRRRVETEFNTERLNDQLLGFFETLTAGEASGPSPGPPGATRTS
ncbi:MAG: glycosyltransferase [Gemmatimonadota bacterium]